MGWFSPQSDLSEELGTLLLEESKSGMAETNALIELLGDCCGEVEDEEQPAFAVCMLEQVRDATKYLENKIRDRFNLKKEEGDGGG